MFKQEIILTITCRLMRSSISLKEKVIEEIEGRKILLLFISRHISKRLHINWRRYSLKAYHVDSY